MGSYLAGPTPNLIRIENYRTFVNSKLYVIVFLNLITTTLQLSVCSELSTLEYIKLLLTFYNLALQPIYGSPADNSNYNLDRLRIEVNLISRFNLERKERERGGRS